MPRPEQIQFLIYPPSKELIEEWRAASRKNGTSLNNYIIEMVEKSRRSDNSNQRPELSRELSDLKEENAKLRNELRIKELILQKYESELYKLRHEAFSDQDHQGQREYDEKLVVALKRGRIMGEGEIYSELGIDPRDAEAVKLVSNQLKGLMRYGLIEETSRGWRWIK
jgi:predicted RNase H-like nuclease (RuvC/YqgF family)